jgi:hypothetical protein
LVIPDNIAERRQQAIESAAPHARLDQRSNEPSLDGLPVLRLGLRTQIPIPKVPFVEVIGHGQKSAIGVDRVT